MGGGPQIRAPIPQQQCARDRAAQAVPGAHQQAWSRLATQAISAVSRVLPMGMVGASQNCTQMDAVCSQCADQRARKLLIFLKSEQIAGQARLIGHDHQRVAARLQEAT